MKYRKLPVEIEATQWFKNGDHPLDGVGMEASDGRGGVYERVEGLVVRCLPTSRSKWGPQVHVLRPDYARTWLDRYP